jgi:hypothetical protein
MFETIHEIDADDVPAQGTSCVQPQVKRERVMPLEAQLPRRSIRLEQLLERLLAVEDLSFTQEGMVGPGDKEHWETEIRKFLLDFGDASDVGLLQ